MTKKRTFGDPITLEFIPSATVEPLITAKVDESLIDVRTKMELYDFSQIPILRGKGPVGVVSWASIGRALSLNPDAVLSDCIEQVFPSALLSDSLLEKIPLINKFGYLLVMKSERKLSGIITGADLGVALTKIAEPFVLIEEYEHQLRRLFDELWGQKLLGAIEVRQYLPSESNKLDRKEAKDYTLGELVMILSKAKIWENFESTYSHGVLSKRMGEVVTLRNKLMHFQPLEDYGTTLGILPQLITMLKAVSVCKPSE